MSLDACHHLGRKLDDHNTCALLCAQFPECLPLSPLDEALAAVATAFATPTERQQLNADRMPINLLPRTRRR
jgi:hypothetical protein